ncbi:MAG: aminoglycoside phosphotransferase family protein [Candidatus Nanopelagicales bacterium]
MDVEDAAGLTASRLGLPEPVLVRRGSATLFRAGSCAIRVEDSTTTLAELSVRLRADGIPSPALLDGPHDLDGVVVTVWEWLESTGRPDHRRLGALIAALGRLHVQEYAVPSAAWRVHDVLDRRRPWPDALPGPLRAALDGVDEALDAATRVTRTVLCHGDLHAGNVGWTESGPVLFDWEFACLGPQWWDLVPIVGVDRVGVGGTEEADALLAGYGEDPRGREEFEGLLRTYLAALTIGMVSRARRDPAAAAEADLRLRWWDGDPSPWTAF